MHIMGEQTSKKKKKLHSHYITKSIFVIYTIKSKLTSPCGSRTVSLIEHVSFFTERQIHLNTHKKDFCAAIKKHIRLWPYLLQHNNKKEMECSLFPTDQSE